MKWNQDNIFYLTTSPHLCKEMENETDSKAKTRVKKFNLKIL